MSRRVVVTGTGVVSSLGHDTSSFWNACLDGRNPVARIPDAWHRYAQFRSHLWAPLELPPFEGRFSRMEIAQNDPVTLMTGECAAQALRGAGIETRLADRRSNTLQVECIDSDRSGVFVGTGVGGVHTLLGSHLHQVLSGTRERLRSLAQSCADAGLREELDCLHERLAHPVRFNPFTVSMLMPNAPAAFVGIKFGLRGGAHSCVQACASGTAAIGQAWQAISRGDLDHALAGGCEYLDDPHGSVFQGFDACRALIRDCEEPARANRPFDARRSGFLFAQGGAAMLMLESAEHAHARGVPPLAEVLGFEQSFDAYHMLNPDPQGRAIEAMLRRLVAGAGLAPAQVDYVNAHGTGTVHNDACEAGVIERVFGRGVAVNSTKSLLGHTLGASGALEALATALSLRDQTLHPSLNLDQPIAELDFVRRRESRRLRFALSQSFAFGGHNAALLLAAPGAGTTAA